MTTADHGADAVSMLVCDERADHRYPSLILAMRDMRRANGRDVRTGDGDGNESWTGLAIGMVALDTLSGSDPDVAGRWSNLLVTHGISADDATIIYKLRCSLLHGWGLPKPTTIGKRKMVLIDDQDAHALDTSEKGRAILSVPVFCRCLVERIARDSPDRWDVSEIDTDIPWP